MTSQPALGLFIKPAAAVTNPTCQPHNVSLFCATIMRGVQIRGQYLMHIIQLCADISDAACASTIPNDDSVAVGLTQAVQPHTRRHELGRLLKLTPWSFARIEGDVVT